MIRKKLITLLLCLSMGTVLLPGCGEGGGNADSKGQSSLKSTSSSEVTPQVTGEEPSGTIGEEEGLYGKIAGNYYAYGFQVDGIEDFVSYFHFYNEIKGLGHVFYAGFAANAVAFTGIYEITEEPFDYKCYAGRDAGEASTGTAPYTLKFYDWNGNLTDQCGFDGDIVYNDMKKITLAGCGDTMYNKDSDGEASKHSKVYSAEPGVSYIDFVGEEDSTSTLSLYHNGTYLDLVGMMVEGTWSITSENADTITIELKPGSGAAASLEVNADKSSAVYTAEDGTTTSLINKANTGTAKYTFTGSSSIEGSSEKAEISISAFEDGTCKVTVNALGASSEIDTGKYTGDGKKFNFTFDKAGNIKSSKKGNKCIVKYKLTGTDIGDINIKLTLSGQED